MFWLNAFFVVLLIGAFAASAHRLFANDRLVQAPRYALLRWLDSRRAKGSKAAWHLIYGFGCIDCGPAWYALGSWLALWSQTGIPAPALSIPAGVLASRYVARYLIKHAGWAGVTVALPDGRQAVQGVRDFPDGVSHPPRPVGKA